MNDVISRLTGFLGPAGSSALGHALLGLVILIVGLFVGKLIVGIFRRMLTKVSALHRTQPDGTVVDMASPIASLIKAVLSIFVLMAVLQHFGLTDVLDPLKDMVSKFTAAVPNIIGAGVTLLVVYFVAKFVVYMLSGLLEGANINAFPQKMGIQGLFTESFTPTRLVGGAIMSFSIFAAATAAVNVLGIEVISEVFAKVLEFGGGLLVGGVILIVGNFLGTIAHDKLSGHGNSSVANIARIAILGLVLAMGLKAMGLADNIVMMAFSLTLGSVAVASALAFGLGGRDAAKAVADNWARKINLQ